MMKEYKRCKYCNLEMLKNEIKCPHCQRIQTIFYIPKNDNHSINHTNKRNNKSYTQKSSRTHTSKKNHSPSINTSNSKSKLTKFIPILIILLILAGIVDKAMHSISPSIGSFIENIISEDDYTYYEDAIECDVEQMTNELKDDYTTARDTYEYQYVMIHGTINDVVANKYDDYFYEISLDDSKYRIFIPIYDYYDDDFADEYKYDNIGTDFTYYGEVSFDENYDDIIYIQNGHFK